jgi:tetratricopeptide (TPR) repeat protein
LRPLVFTLFALAALAPAQQTQLDVDPRLFSVLAAINAAGYDTDLDSPNTHPLREEVRKVLAGKRIDVLPELKRFVLEHKQANPAADLSQYVSFALSVRSVPEFEFLFREDELPPDVRTLGGLDRLMQRFHREAGIDELFAGYAKVFDDAMAKYQEGATRSITEVNAYLRMPSVGALGRSFKVLIDLLGAPNQIQVKNFQDDYYLVITPSAEPQIDYLRYSYFRFAIDPLTLKYGEELKQKRGLIDYAQGAGALDPVYKQDFQLLAGASLIKAIEARLAPLSRRAAMIDTALREGYVMAPAFAELLPEYEKQEASMRIYFPDLVKAINLKKEEKRLAEVDFLKEKTVKRAKVAERPPLPAQPVVSGALKKIDDAEELVRQKDLPGARTLFLAAVKEAEFTSTKAKAYFGLARIAILQKQNEEGLQLFQTALDSQPEPHVRAMSHYYLGRLNELAGEPDQAMEHFRNALATPGITSQAKALAEKAIAEAQKRRDNK